MVLDDLTFDEEVAVTQEILTEEMIVAEMRVDESIQKRERKEKMNRKLTFHLWRNQGHHKYVKP